MLLLSTPLPATANGGTILVVEDDSTARVAATPDRVPFLAKPFPLASLSARVREA
jgi:hypothetical protein